MGRAERMPDDATLRHWYLDDKLTYQQMADRWKRDPQGDDATRMAFQARCHKADWFVPRNMRHSGTDQLPWTDIRPEHMDLHDIQMVRKHSARMQGKEWSPRINQMIDSWLLTLREEDAVIAYHRDTVEGWWHVKRKPGDVGIVRWPAGYKPQNPLHQPTPQAHLELFSHPTEEVS